MPVIPESHKDLLNSQVAMLATNGPDGYPQVSAIWFLLDDDGEIRISLHPRRQKYKNLQADPKCTLFLLDPANPYRTLEIRGDATITPDPDYVFAEKVNRKYNADLRTMDPPGTGRVVVTLHPVKANTYGDGG